MRTTVIIVGDDDLDAARSKESIASVPALAGARVLCRPLADAEPWSEVTDGQLVFVRAGDRLLPGVGAALSDALAECDAVIGAHLLAGRGGWGTEIQPPSLSSLDELRAVAVDVPFELSAIAARRAVLHGAVSPAPGAPGGDVALVGALLARGRCRSIHTVVAEVRMRSVHQGDPAALLERLRGVLHGPLGADETVAARLRRRALSVAYLESPPSVSERFAADAWWAPAALARGPGTLLAITRDLHWVAARLAEARHIAEVGLDGVIEEAPIDAITAFPADVNNLRATNESLELICAEMRATVRWLHAEVRARDEALEAVRARLAKTNVDWSEIAVETRPEGSGLEAASASTLLRLLGAKVKRRLRRVARRRAE